MQYYKCITFRLLEDLGLDVFDEKLIVAILKPHNSVPYRFKTRFGFFVSHKFRNGKIILLEMRQFLFQIGQLSRSFIVGQILHQSILTFLKYRKNNNCDGQNGNFNVVKQLRITKFKI